MSLHAIVIEDEEDIREVIEYNLTREGFSVETSRNGEEGLNRIRENPPDVVLLDLMLEGMDGLEVCRSLKSDPRTRDVPIVMVTAKGDESDIVLGLGLGADDYVPKPFSPKELVARVQAVLRRSRAPTAPRPSARLKLERLVIDMDRHEILLDGHVVDFTQTELKLLHFLATNPGKVLTRDKLISEAMGPRAVVVDRNIDVHIGSIRRKLKDLKSLITTVRGVGYRFDSPPA